MTYTRTAVALTTTALALTLSAPSALVAQEGSGLRGTISFRQGLEISDNPGLTSDPSGIVTQSRTGLDFSLASETKTELLRVSIGTDVFAEFGTDNDDIELNNDRAVLFYSRESVNSRLAFDARYANTRLDDIVFGTDLDPDIFVLDGGNRETTSASLTFETGLARPLGFEITARTRRVDYVGTADPDLEDQETLSVDTVTRFRINPQVSGRLVAGWSERNTSDIEGTTVERKYLGLGIEGETSRGLSFSGDIIYDVVDTTTDTPASSREEDGVGFDLTVTQDRPAGELGFAFSSRIDDNGRQTRAIARRAFDLPLGGLELSLGIIDFADDSSNPRLTGTVGWSRETPRGGFSANLSQTPSADDGDTYVNTRLSVNYRQEINNISSWNAGVTYAAVDQLGGDDDDSRASASVSYTRDLTEDWQLRTGFEHIRVEEAGGDDRRSNTVFFNLQRDFSFGF